jgi:hypothetical protein
MFSSVKQWISELFQDGAPAPSIRLGQAELFRSSGWAEQPPPSFPHDFVFIPN